MAEANTSTTGALCMLCFEPVDENAITCYVCRRSGHLKCVGITTGDAPNPWSCGVSCSKTRSRSNARSISRTSIASSTARLELQRLEEELALAKKRALAEDALEDQQEAARIERQKQRDAREEQQVTEREERRRKREQRRAEQERKFIAEKYEILQQSGSLRDGNSSTRRSYVSSWVDEVNANQDSVKPTHDINFPNTDIPHTCLANSTVIDQAVYTQSQINPKAPPYVPIVNTNTITSSRPAINDKVMTPLITHNQFTHPQLIGNQQTVRVSVHQPLGNDTNVTCDSFIREMQHITNSILSQPPPQLPAANVLAQPSHGINTNASHNPYAMGIPSSRSIPTVSHVYPPCPPAPELNVRPQIPTQNPTPGPSSNFASNTFPTVSQISHHPPTNIPAVDIQPSQHDISARQIATRQVLPRDLPSFSGTIEEWAIFIANFEQSTRLCGYSNAENAIRLQRSLRGKALEAVRCLLPIPDAVPLVIDTLRMRYGNPEDTIHNVLSKIRSEPPLKADKLENIIDFAQMVQNVCGLMISSKMDSHLSNPILIRELSDKLPPQQRLAWGMFMESNPVVNLATFSSWLQQLARAACKVTRPSTIDSEAKCSKNNQKGVYTHTSTASPIETNNKNAKPTPPETAPKTTTRQSGCPACLQNTGHKLESCPKFLGLNRNARWAVIKSNNLCYKCFGVHFCNHCKSKKLCGISDCKLRHHELLHKNEDVTPVATSSAACNAHSSSSPTLLHRIVPVTLYGDKTSVDTFAFLDEGSSITLLESETADKLGLCGPVENLCLKWTAEVSRVEESSKRVKVGISSSGKGQTSYCLNDVRTVHKLNLPSQSISDADISGSFEHLRGIPIAEYHQATPRILIGLDNYHVAIPLKILEGLPSEPTATKTRLGWVIHGPLSSIATRSTKSCCNHYHACECQQNELSLESIIKDYMLLDSFGVNQPHQTLESDEENRAREILSKTTIRNEKGFTSGLLWRFDDVQLPDSLPMARKRFSCLEKKMARDPDLTRLMYDQIQTYVENGYIRKLTPTEVATTTPRTWYLPIFAITNPNKPGKFRIVWDAAAKVGDVSLNTMLLKGSDLLSNLVGVLVRFRERQVAVCGDIKHMFHQVRIRTEDQNSQRFLWRTDPSSSEPDVYVMEVMTFGATFSPCTAQYVMNHNATEYADCFPQAAVAIQTNHYVDDWLDCTDTAEQAIKLAKSVREVHSYGGFEIRNWVSNSAEVLNALEPKTSTKPTDLLEIGADKGTSKILGMWWCTRTDTFTFSLTNNKSSREILDGTKRPTKREVLRTVMSVYDPLGLLANLIVFAKILLQDIWRTEIGWDDKLLDEEYQKWLLWIQVLHQVETINVPRCIHTSSKPSSAVQLHTFVDASASAYAAVVYLRISDESGIQCTLLAAKTRVAPTKPMSIPRLELQAATLGARLANTVAQMLTIKIDERMYWSDSRNVLCWIRSDARKYKQFVAFRISEILDTTSVSLWHWVPTKDNIADQATKWIKPPCLNSNSPWFKGPDFLYSQQENWPRESSHPGTSDEEVLPVRACMIHTENDDSIWEYTRFSNWWRLLRAQAFVLRFVHNSKCAIKKVESTSPLRGPLQPDELRQGSIALIKYVQKQSYAAEVACFQNNGPHARLDKTSVLHQRSPFMDPNGLLRMRGRITAATCVDENAKQPILLPKEHPVTMLIADSFHRRYHHHNFGTALNEMIQMYSVPSARSVMNRVRNKCQRCKNERATIQIPEMGDLPAARLAAYHRPFTFTGVDLFGPIAVTVGRRNEKRWSVLFTCLTIRAIHIELAHSLSTDSFLLCLRNFVSRRGTPNELFCDNGTNFHGAESELRTEMKKINFDQCQIESANVLLKWNFIPPSAPHMGGAWERLVRSTKTSLYAILKTHKPSDELLRSILLEVEMIVNSRPLTHIPIDNMDSEALTPNHFLIGSSFGGKGATEFNDDGAYLRRCWKLSQKLAKEFWQRWVTEYLPTLTRRTKWFQHTKPIEIGDVVIMVDPDSPKSQWTKAIVKEVSVGSNGQVRKTVVQTTQGIYNRPASKLAVLDVIKK